MNEFQIMHRIPDSVTEKLNSILQGEDLAEVYMFLASNASNPCFVQVLNTTVHDDLAFRATVKTMLDDVKNMKEDGSYSRVMADVWNALMPFSDQSGATQSFNLSAALAHPDTCKNATSYNMITIIARMPLESQASMLQVAYNVSRSVLGESWAVAVQESVSNSLQAARGAASKMVPVILVGVFLAADVISNMRRWWKDEISGQRCAKNIIDSGVGLAAGIGGGFGGAALGTMVFPGVGTLIGGIVGGVLSAEICSRISDWITQKIFNLPKSEAVENAYRVLGVPHNTSNSEINTKFRKLCLEHHPDKGGNVEDFYKLQYAMQVLRMSRESDQ